MLSPETAALVGGCSCSAGLLPCIYYVSVIRVQRQQNLPVAKPISATDIEQSFPVTMVSNAPMCAVCLSPVDVGEPCRATQCHHHFHADCLVQWWVYKPRRTLNCPVCRQPQLLEPPRVTDGGVAAA